MCTGFGIYVVHTSSGLFGSTDLFRTRIKSGEGVQYRFDFTETSDNPSETRLFTVIDHG